MPVMINKEQIKHFLSVKKTGIEWTDIVNISEKDKEFLSQRYPFHPLDLDDCSSRVQRPKIDVYNDYLFIVLHFPVYNKESKVTEASQVSIFIGANYLITVHEGRLKPLNRIFEECRDNEDIQERFLTHGTVYLLYRLIDALVDYCFPIMKKVGENVEAIEDKIFAGKSKGLVKEISVLRRDIISLRRIINPMRATIGMLEPRVEKFSKQDMEVYFGDTVDHLDKLREVLDEHKEVIEGLNNTYDSLASDKMNDILRVLTILTTIGTILMVITGFYGMNIYLPGGVEKGASFLAFGLLIVGMLLVVVLMMIYFKRKDWL
jgi:magnesium transporter